MTDDERKLLASWLDRGTGSEAEKRRQAARVAAQLRTDGERIKALEAALERMVREGFSEPGSGSLGWCAVSRDALLQAEALLNQKGRRHDPTDHLGRRVVHHARRWKSGPLPADLMADLADILQDVAYTPEKRVHQIVWQALKWSMENPPPKALAP